jgi:methylated-DNA-protein-cysteine methyltransferase related protein
MFSSLLNFPFCPHEIFFCISFIFLLRFSWPASQLSLHQTRILQKGRLPDRCQPTNIFVAMSTWDPVYKLVRQIPRGRVTTYGALAKALKLRGGARTAGHAMAASPSGKGIPWHRVVGAGGKLLIREPHSSLQRKLLESEGVTVLESRVAIKKHLWTPPRKKRATKR